MTPDGRSGIDSEISKPSQARIFSLAAVFILTLVTASCCVDTDEEITAGAPIASASEAPTAQAPASQNPTLASLATQLTSSEWSTVYTAKGALESLEAQAIPVLQALLSRDEYVKLQNTADLIYPGATEFWEHGLIVDYDIDWISVRAGWALEDLTFQNFGFREESISEDAVLKYVMASKGLPISSILPPKPAPEAKRERRLHAVSAATVWWARSSHDWNRFAAVIDALKSGDAARQVEALSWLRHGETPCQGLSKETFTQSILPEVRRLTRSGDSGVKEQADYLLHDFESNEWYWLSIKAH